MSAQIERALQAEIVLRLRTEAWPVVAFGVPNGIFLPSRNAAERSVAARVVSQLKSIGGLTPGAPDLVIAGQGRVIFLEVKREQSRDLMGHVTRAGRLSEAQREFQSKCDAAGVPYAVVRSWSEVREHLSEWGVTG